MRLNGILIKNIDGSYTHWCEGCKTTHDIFVEQQDPKTGNQWIWNGDDLNPTFSPPVRHERQMEHSQDVEICHYIIDAGVIKYYDDSTHQLAGRATKILDLP